MKEVGICLGTYNRLPQLQRAIESFRRSCGSLSYEIIVVDGGSVDGTLEWLRIQPDVVLIEQGQLLGAVRAFNAAFARAVEDGCSWIVVLNDDDALIGPEPEIERCVQRMRGNASIGAVAFETNLRGGWTFEEWNGKPYANKGVVRREALMAAARVQGDPDGKCFWSPEWHTYAADTQAGLLLWKLGWSVERGHGLRVDDSSKQPDALRRANVRRYAADGTVAIFHKRWDDAHAADYDQSLAREFGGRVA